MIRSMARFRARTAVGLALAVLCTPVYAQDVAGGGEDVQILSAEEGAILLEAIHLTAEDQLKQAPGVSIITAEDLEKAPPARDLSEILRKMPGVNLTGNSPSGSRGNNRQIDIRGMGPENTLIMIDGKPVLSRNSVRYSHSGERDTRGDSNWVPPELIERVEVIRGPAAARYGSGASGGVVNIITKRPTEQIFTLGAYVSEPQDSNEGGSRRTTFTAAGPINDQFGYRVSAGWSRSDADALDLNAELSDTGAATAPAGREGVVSYDLRGLLTYEHDPSNRFDFELGWGRQRNIYAGDVPWGGAGAEVAALVGDETNRMTRQTVSLSHYGDYGFGSTESLLQYERTNNRRLGEGAVGRTEGTIDASDLRWTDSDLDNLFGKTELYVPFSLGVEQVATLGADIRYEKLDDPASVTAAGNTPVPGWVPPADSRETEMSSWLLGLYAESNMNFNGGLTLTPGLRFDQHEHFGANFSPSLNLTWQATPEITLKGGVARAFKAPNIYQLNPNYLYNSRGNGCWQYQGPCYIVGNTDLDPEISLNKEIGVNYSNVDGWNAGVTYFHNDYRNKITSGRVTYDTTPVDTGWGPGVARLMRWENSGDAVVAGLEGNLTIPIADSLSWSTNFTWMEKSEDADGQPLSMIPKHTVNTALTWRATDRLDATLSATHYGETEPPTASTLTGGQNTGDALQTREAYWIANLGLSYDVSENARIVAGINNLFDEQLLRSGDGANTYNEPGRSFYLGVTTTW